jgi:hypothetical protein
VSQVVSEVGSVLSGHRRTFLIFALRLVGATIVVEHQERVAHFDAKEVEATLALRDGSSSGSTLPRDDLVRDVTETPDRHYARLYGRRRATIVGRRLAAPHRRRACHLTSVAGLQRRAPAQSCCPIARRVGPCGRHPGQPDSGARRERCAGAPSGAGRISGQEGRPRRSGHVP